MELNAYDLGRNVGWSLFTSSFSILTYSIYSFFARNKKTHFRSIKLTSIWRRHLAFFVDLIILSFIIFSPLTSIEIANPYYEGISKSLLAITIICLYFAILESTFQGTIGKSIFGIKVINYDGNPISFTQASIRSISYFIYFIPFLAVSIYGVHQGFHNHFAKTKVVDNDFIKHKLHTKKKVFNFFINIDNFMHTRRKIYHIFNIASFVIPIVYIITFSLQSKIMRKITSFSIFHKFYEKKYHRYLSFKLNYKKSKNWFLSRNIFLTVLFFLLSFFLIFIGINFIFIMDSKYSYFSILFFYTGYSSYKLSKVYFLADAKTLTKKDTRKPIILLHSFQDNNLSIFSHPMLFGIRKDIRLEEAISPVLNRVGPFVSIGNPTHWIPRLGTAKTFEQDEEWQSRVLEWMEKSRYLVFMINDSLGLEWELNKAIEYDYISKIMIIFPDSETVNYQERIDFTERVFKENNIIISIPYNLKVLFFDNNKKSISIVSNDFYQEDYEEAINLFIYYKEGNRDMKLYPYL